MNEVCLDQTYSAELYGVETKVINQAVKRNIEQFPEEKEMNKLVTNCDRFKNLKHSTVFPYVFTEQGVAMLSAVLHSPTAIQVSIRIMDTFAKLRHYVSSQIVKTDDKTELAEIQRLLLLHIDRTKVAMILENAKPVANVQGLIVPP